jgi:hypothetical protein
LSLHLIVDVTMSAVNVPYTITEHSALHEQGR